MSRLMEALQALGLEDEISLSGRWLKLRGERCSVYVAEAAWDAGYYAWCDDREERAVEHYLDPTEAIQAALKRAA